jgi:hypothetical protein
MASLHFYEKQNFRQWWIWIILVLAFLIPIGIFIGDFQNQKQQVFEPSALTGLMFSSIIVFFVLMLLYLANLETEIDEYLISYKFFPFHFSHKKIYWEDVDRAYVCKYSPIGDFGGWGLRYSFRKGKAFNVSGNMGLQIILKTGKKILFGTQKQSELDELMKHLYERKIVKGQA